MSLGYSIKLVTGTTTNPVTLAEAREQIRFAPGSTGNDSYLTRMIRLATERVEADGRRTLIKKTYDYKLNAFPTAREIEIPLPPLNTINTSTGIHYVNTTGTSVAYPSTKSSATWEIDTAREPGLLRLQYDQDWPDTRPQSDAVTIRFVAGSTSVAKLQDTHYGETARHAILLLLDDYFNHRGSVVVGGGSAEIAETYKDLIARIRPGQYV